MEPNSTIEKLSSGDSNTILAVIVVALAVVIVMLYRRNNELQDKMLEMTRESDNVQRQMLSQYHTAINANTNIVTEAIRRLEAMR